MGRSRAGRGATPAWGVSRTAGCGSRPREAASRRCRKGLCENAAAHTTPCPRAACLVRMGLFSVEWPASTPPPLALTTPPTQLRRQPSAELQSPALACWQAGASVDWCRPAPALSSWAGRSGRPCSRVAPPPHRPYVASREHGEPYALERRPTESGGRGRLSAHGAPRGVANFRRPWAGGLERRAALHSFCPWGEASRVATPSTQPRRPCSSRHETTERGLQAQGSSAPEGGLPRGALFGCTRNASPRAPTLYIAPSRATVAPSKPSKPRRRPPAR